MGDVIHIKTKTRCQICGDGYADENFMIGRCCGLPLIEVPYTKEDYENDRIRQEIIQDIMNKKFDWD
ncbi:hypothetical protein pEaSNUABM49_00079 [Erwinia phage pEa_SNUABM_49]|nr:hypothetical protein pEaSNUABM49_00079 [Erwinia phage pEa_SNUABM_49]